MTPQISDDEWFLSLPPERKTSIRRWLDGGRVTPPPDPLQYTIDEVIDEAHA